MESQKILATMQTSSLDLFKVRPWEQMIRKKPKFMCFYDSPTIYCNFPIFLPKVLYIVGNLILWPIMKYNARSSTDYP